MLKWFLKEEILPIDQILSKFDQEQCTVLTVKDCFFVIPKKEVVLHQIKNISYAPPIYQDLTQSDIDMTILEYSNSTKIESDSRKIIIPAHIKNINLAKITDELKLFLKAQMTSVDYNYYKIDSIIVHHIHISSDNCLNNLNKRDINANKQYNLTILPKIRFKNNICSFIFTLKDIIESI